MKRLQQKIQVYHFHNGSGGGVLSVIRNLLKFSKNPGIENHIIYTINKKGTPVYSINNIEGAVSEKVFYYSPKWNFYNTCRRLAKLIPTPEALVVAHDWLELGMMSNLGLQNPLVHFLHGDYSYYYQLAQAHEAAIDQFICVAQNIETKLIDFIPGRKRDIAYLRFPIPAITTSGSQKINGNIIFIGRLTAEKGYSLLPLIAGKLREKNIAIMWHIVGAAEGVKDDDVAWDKNSNVHFYGNISNNEVIKLLQEMQILILPTLAEGMPVVVVEAMKSGVIPLVNNISGGIQELVVNNQTGYKINDNNIADYTEKVIQLMENKTLADTIKNNCIEKANAMFEPFNNTKIIETVFQNTFSSVKERKISKKIYGSRLDQAWLPDIFTKSIRGIKFP